MLGVPMLFSTTISFAMFMFLTTWTVAMLHMKQQTAFGATVAWGAFGLTFNLLGGALSDRHGRKALMVLPRVVFLLLIIPGFAWIADARTEWVLFLVTAVLTSLVSLSNGVSIVCLTESIPKSVRSASLAIIYAVVIAAFNGTAQLLVTWLIKRTGDVLWPAYYMTAATLVGIAAMSMMRETAPMLEMALVREDRL
jgi:MFS family permease